MLGRPDLVDNLTDDTRHAAALTFLANDPGTSGRPVSVATGYVNLGGLHHLAITVDDGRGVKLLLGAVPDPALGAQLPIPRFELALRALAGERDLARFPPSRLATQLAGIDSWLDDPSVEVRRYVQQFLHGKAYLFGSTDDARAALVGSANLTGAGLFRNLELGVVDYNPGVAGAAIRWFDGLWGAATEFKDDLRHLLFPDVGVVDPRTVYLRALLELYGDELLEESDGPPIASVQLAPFQRHGFDRARVIAAEHGGVVYADGVGTGKTEIGLAFIEDYALNQGFHALVVAPAQLVENWQSRIDQARLPAQVVSFQQLAADEQLAPPTVAHQRRYLHSDRNSYRLVVIDEGHAFRSPDTGWYRALDRLLGGEPKHLVLLTATPINNGLWDLYHLVMTFARHDRAFAGGGIPSLRDLFRDAGANERDPENLNPDILFPLADAVSVRRDRRFIEAHYPGAVFADGTPVRFPTPRMTTFRYDLDAAHPGLVREITDLIASLTMARYRPSSYDLTADSEDVSEAALAALLQSGILKRFESCWWACRNSVRRRLSAHDAFLAAWDAQSLVPSPQALRDAASEELDDAGIATWLIEAVTDADDSRPIEQFRPQFRDDVARDRDVLQRLMTVLDGLNADDDPKLSKLREILESSPSAKVAVFATFADTLRYLDEHLPDRIGGRERVVVIGSETDPDVRTNILARFCPHTVVREDYEPADGEVDLLLSTDVLSEGQNLQQAAAVISYDMPWNPQRVVQRNGRVIRLKSPHEKVDLATMLPSPGELEDFLRLEVAIRRKIAAAGVYGMETEVIEGIDTELRSYAGRLEGGDATLLDEDSIDGGAGGFSGEELRAELLRALNEGEVDRLRALPWGIGAAFRQGPGVPSIGAPGVFFACRTTDDTRYWRFVESDQDKDVVTTTADMLRRIDPGSAVGEDPTGLIDLEAAWRIAVDSIVAEHNAAAAAPTESIGPVQRFALELLRDPSLPLPLGGAAAESALSVERGGAVRSALGGIRRGVHEGEHSREQALELIVGVVDEYGLREVPPPEPLEPITEDDVGVVCWMGVLAP